MEGLILAMNGLASEADRASEARKLLEWSFTRSRSTPAETGV